MPSKMKTAGFIVLAFLFCLVVHAPAQLLRPFLPDEVKAGSVAGSLWHGSLHQVSWRTLNIEQIGWRLKFSSWRPSVALELHDRDGMSGRGTLRGWQQLQLVDWQLLMPAELLRQNLSLPTPVTAKGILSLRLQHAVLERENCTSIQGGLIQWRDAELVTPFGQMELNTPQMTVNCIRGGLDLLLEQSSPALRLSGRGTLDGKGHYNFSGKLRGGEALTDPAKSLLNTLGKANQAGEIPWQFAGQLP